MCALLRASSVLYARWMTRLALLLALLALLLLLLTLTVLRYTTGGPRGATVCAASIAYNHLQRKSDDFW